MTNNKLYAPSFPPLALAIIIAFAMKATAWLTPWSNLSNTATLIIASTLFILGSIPIINALYLFVQAKTTANPIVPESSSMLVTHGCYRYSRNPMYLGFVLLLIAWSFWLGNIMTIAGALLMYWQMNSYQIPWEEKALTKKFGERFTRYCSTTRRWL